MTAINFFLLLFIWYQRTYNYYGRRHFKLFTNCHVSWGTLYLTKTLMICKLLIVSKLYMMQSFLVFTVYIFVAIIKQMFDSIA